MGYSAVSLKECGNCRIGKINTQVFIVWLLKFFCLFENFCNRKLGTRERMQEIYRWYYKNQGKLLKKITYRTMYIVLLSFPIFVSSFMDLPKFNPLICSMNSIMNIFVHELIIYFIHYYSRVKSQILRTGPYDHYEDYRLIFLKMPPELFFQYLLYQKILNFNEHLFSVCIITTIKENTLSKFPTGSKHFSWATNTLTNTYWVLGVLQAKSIVIFWFATGGCIWIMSLGNWFFYKRS